VLQKHKVPTIHEHYCQVQQQTAYRTGHKASETCRECEHTAFRRHCTASRCERTAFQAGSSNFSPCITLCQVGRLGQRLGIATKCGLDIPREVDVEKVNVESCLNKTCNNGDRVNVAFRPVSVVMSISFKTNHPIRPSSPVDPVGNVKCTVYPHSCDIMRRDRLGLASSLEHKQLGEDRNSL
jgi:hypothetical protein